MVNEKFDVAIIGAGIGGLYTLKTIINTDLKIILIDENPKLGGQYLRYSESKKNDKWETKTRKKGIELVKEFSKNNYKNLKIFTSSTVGGIFDKKIVFDSNGIVHTVEADLIVIATGARETVVPFKGWTLPGVYTTGGIQVLLKSYNQIPEKEIIIAGTGPFLYAVAYELITHNIKPKEIIFENNFLDTIKSSISILKYPQKLLEGIVYLEEILRHMVKISYGWKIISAHGKDHLEEIKIKKGSKERTIKTKALAIGNGFVPNIELFQQLGCELFFDNELEMWLPKINDYYETSIKGVFSVGETNGIGGAEKSMEEGKFVGNYILYLKEKIDENKFKEIEKKHKKIKEKWRKYSILCKNMSEPPLNFYSELNSDTIICRCEDVKLKDLEEYLFSAKDSLDPLKMYARVGLGLCQGRTCGPILQKIINSKFKKLPKPFNVRPPVKPINIEDYTKGENNGS